MNRSVYTLSTDIYALAMRGYSIGHKIGEGAHATVITATYATDNEPSINLACKIIDKRNAPTDFVDKFFPRELEILKKINHPNIIQIHSIVRCGLKTLIFMRCAENGDLLTLIKCRGPLAEARSKIWFAQTATALKYLHSINIAHRDLKCGNLLLSKRQNIKLADFGFARYCTDGNGQDTKSETYCGSAAYAAPEVVSGNPYDPKLADAWSLGVILFIMLNGKMPFDDSTLSKLVQDQQNKNYTYRRSLQEKISPEAKSMVSVLLEPKLDARWNMDEILKCIWLCKDKMSE